MKPGRVAPVFQVRIDQHHVHLPALATAHSHAFQRGLRGFAQRRGLAAGTEDFWSWRAEMYRAALALTPESFEQVTRIAYRELAQAGVRTVGEFHYVHHQADGTPYAQRTLLSEIAIAVAREEGLRIALLRAAYFRGGPGREPEPGQQRFCDPSPDHVLADVETLCTKYKHDPGVVIGLAPHSVRAVPPEYLRVFAEYARAQERLLHMHVSETDREVAECESETGMQPVQFLESIGALALGQRFVAVHCTQVTEAEAQVLGASGAFACLCPTTERDLGDGLANMKALRSAGARICIGIDSHVITDPIEELRALETHERLRTKSRITFSPNESYATATATVLTTPAEALWFEGSIATAQACGFEDAGGEVRISRAHPALALVPEARLLDAIVFSGNCSMFV
jgi:formimidoylglutamate deiminase